MHIAVAVRLTPEAGEELDVDFRRADIDREFVDETIRDFDDQALEEAFDVVEELTEQLA